MRIVMLGKLRSGKSTVGNIIKELVLEHFGLELKSKPLATPIYKEAHDFYNRHNLIWRKNRKLLEGIGEALNDDYPLGDKVTELYKETFDPYEDIYVDDCRRLPQADFFKEAGSFFIRVNATVETRKARCKPGEWSEGHVTDTELDDYKVDFTIDNDGDNMDELKAQVYEKVIYPIKELYGLTD